MKATVFFLALLVGSAYGQERKSSYYFDRSSSLLDQKKMAEAEIYADSAIAAASRSSSLDSLMAAYLWRYEVHTKMKDFEKAVGDFRMATVYLDSIRTLKNNSVVEGWKSSLEIEKGSHQKDVVAVREEIIRLQEAARTDWQNTLFIIGGMLFLLGLGVFIIYREKSKLQKTLKESEEDIRHLRAFKDKLFTVLSYDLHSSLSSFEKLTQGLSVQLDTLNKVESVQFLTKLYITAGDLKSTLNNVIQWVALQANAMPYRPVFFDCKMIVEQSLERFRTQLTDRNLTAEDFMPNGQDVYADKEMVEIILGNLFSNAIHFTQPGGSITCFSGRKDGLVTMGVKDTGVGIAKENMDKLFKSDVDFHSIGKPSHKGAGVGLILCKELVERNGGRMYVESIESQGSTFYFTLPEKKIV